MKTRTTVQRRIISLALVLMFVLSMCTIAYAADDEPMPISGTETWYAGSGYVGSLTLEDGNLTPVKTMGASGTLWVHGSAVANNNGNSWWIRVQIISYNTGKVLAETTSTPRADSKQAYAVSLNVTKGQQIQIYLTYGSKPVNDAKVELYYIL